MSEEAKKIPASPSAKPSCDPSEHARHRREMEFLISLYQDGEANPAEILKVETALQTCGECRRLLDSYQLLGSQLKGYLDNIPVGTRQVTVRQLQERLQSETAPLPQSGSTPTLTAKNRSKVAGGPVIKYAFSFAMVAIVLIVSVLMVSFLNQPAQPLPVTQVLGSKTELTGDSLTPTPTAQSSVTPENAVTNSTQTPNNPPLTPVASQGNNVVPGLTPALTGTITAEKNPQITASVSVSAAATGTIDSGNQPGATLTSPVIPVSSKPGVETVTAEISKNPPVTAVTQVRTVTTRASEPTITSRSGGDLTPQPTPEIVTANGWIAYINSLDSEIYLVNSDGSKNFALTSRSVENRHLWRQLVWSADARSLAAVAYYPDGGSYYIYTLKVDTVSRSIATPVLVTEGIAPLWSPGGTWFSYLAGPVKSLNGIQTGQPAVFNLNRHYRTLLSQTYSGLTPQWFDDEERLLLNQSQVVDLDGNMLVSLKIFENSCAASGLSPSGNKLAVLETEGSGFRPVIYDLSSSSPDQDPPSKQLNFVLQGKLGHGNDCGSYRIKWVGSDSFYFYLTQQNNPTTCLVSSSRGVYDCFDGVVDPSFNGDGSAYVDHYPTSGSIYAALPADKPDNPLILGQSRYSPVWQPVS